MAVELRPLGVGEKLDAAFSLYRRNFLTLITIVAVIVVPLQLVSAVIAAALVNDLPTDPNEITGDDLTAFFVSSMVLGLVSLLATLVATAGVVKAAADDYLGDEPDWKDSLRFAFSKSGALVVGGVLFIVGLVGAGIAGSIVLTVLVLIAGGIGALIGVFLLLGLLIALAVSWSVWVPAVVVESSSGFRSLGRSYQLVKGRRWPVLGYLLLVYLIVFVLTLIVGAALGALVVVEPTAFDLDPVGTVINLILALLTTPFVAAAIVVVYFDQRVRSEGFDIEYLATQIRSEPLPSTFGTTGEEEVPEGFGSLEAEPPPEPPPAWPPPDES